MHLSRRIMWQLIVFAVIAVVALSVIGVGYVKIPAMLGIGQYTVTVDLATSGGLYPRANVTYRGTNVGKVESIGLGDRGVVHAQLSLRSGTTIPSNVEAQVHSQSAFGEQYVELLPRDGSSPPLADGDVIALRDTSVPPPIDAILDATDRGLQAIPQQNLETLVDESYTAFGGLGPELSRIVRGATALSIDARENLDSITTLIDQSAPVLDSQSDSADDIAAWASNMVAVADQLRDNDTAVAGLLENGGPAAAQARQLVERLRPTLPIILANLVTVGKVVLDYQAGLEQLLVLIPQGVAANQGAQMANLHSPHPGIYQAFNLNLNLPPPCTTGFLPAQQRRTPNLVDTPERPAGDLYCRVPQDSPFNVRGARNYPCLTVPGKRAPTVRMCESDEQYVPLNDGYNWKGDPNATTTGQDVPQLPPGEPSAEAPPVAVAEYDTATGNYVAPDGHIYTRTDLADGAPARTTWQEMLIPPGS